LDISEAAAIALGMKKAGIAKLAVEVQCERGL
jgi:rare lipoprotein A (peptidoglycan hydrolase)